MPAKFAGILLNNGTFIPNIIIIVICIVLLKDGPGSLTFKVKLESGAIELKIPGSGFCKIMKDNVKLNSTAAYSCAGVHTVIVLDYPRPGRWERC